MKKDILNKRQKEDYITAYLMILPLFLGLLVFYIYPTIKVFIDSFFKVGAFGKREFYGINNYIMMFRDSVMWRSLLNTFIYVIVIVPGNLVLSLIVASLLNSNIKFKSLFRTIYFLPAITMGTAVAIVWKWMYNSDFGIINNILNLLGFESMKFITNPKIAIYAISAVGIWVNIGYNMIILLAGMQGISNVYYEAAKIDGASPIKQFFHITLPLVTPSLFFVLITSLIGTFQTFDIIFMMIEKTGIALEATQSMVVYFYINAFEFSKKGYASAIAVFLFLIILFITFIQMKLQKRWVNYD